MFPGKPVHIIHFCFCDLPCECSGKPFSVLMDMKHDLSCLYSLLMEYLFKDMDDKVHGGIVIVEEEDMKKRWFAQLQL